MRAAGIASLVILFSLSTQAGDWITVGGNVQRNGLSGEVGPTSSTVLWSKPSPYSIWGNQIYIFGNRLVTTRYTSLSPLRALLACHDVTTGDSLWTRNYAENGVMIMMGFNNNTIYARNFQQQGSDTIYAISPDDGSVIWQSQFTVERGIIWSAVFTANGDLILPGSGTRSIMRIDHTNGDTVWTLTRTIPNTGAECMCLAGNTLYAWEGSITTPKRIMAIDAGTGITKYFSDPLPGDGDQELQFSLGLDGTVFAARDGGNLYALTDNGLGFTQLWSIAPIGPIGTYAQFAVANDSSVYIPMGHRVYHLNQRTGAVVDSSAELIVSGTLNARIAIDAAGTIFVGNGASDPAQGKYVAFTSDLQVLWSTDMPYNYYSGPALGQGGILVFCGGGQTITAYQMPTSVPQARRLPSELTLEQNYPNPFNPNTTIRFSLQESGMTTLAVFDELGREVSILIKKPMNAGTYERILDASALPSGVYFYRLTVGNATTTRRMLLIK